MRKVHLPPSAIRQCRRLTLPHIAQVEPPPVVEETAAANLLRVGACREHEEHCRTREFAAWRVFAPSAEDILAAVDLHARAKIGFRDAMIVLAASESGCDVLWTDDLSDGQRLRGVRIRNPFTERP